MGKALSIKDGATYDLVAELAHKSGTSMTQAIEGAIASHLQALIEQRVEQAKIWLAKVKSHGVDDEFMANRWQPPIDVMNR